MTTTMYQPNPSLVEFTRENIIYNQQGIDSISFMARHGMVIKLFERLGFRATRASNTPVTKQIKALSERATHSDKRRYDTGEPASREVFKTTKGSSLSSYVIVERYTAPTMDYDAHHAKAKGTYCLVHFMGLHQPTKRLHSDVIGVVADIMKRKRFKLYSYDLATDIRDPREITSQRKEAFKYDLNPISKYGVISTGSSLYINNPQGVERVSRILFYDKYHKQTRGQKQSLSLNLMAWRRGEITITFDLCKKENRMSGAEYFKSLSFINDLSVINDIMGRMNPNGWGKGYLNYQINSLLDKRVMNNTESKKRFNSIEALRRFETSGFRVIELELLV